MCIRDRDPAIAALVNGDKDTAFELWSAALSDDHCPATVVAKHNLAVMYHLVALDSEHIALSSDLEPAQLATVDKHWRTSFKWWEELADDEMCIRDRVGLNHVRDVIHGQVVLAAFYERQSQESIDLEMCIRDRSY